jgi:hypothetical protein
MNYEAIPSLVECNGCKHETCAVSMKWEDLQQPTVDQQVTEMLTSSVLEQTPVNNDDERPW